VVLAVLKHCQSWLNGLGMEMYVSLEDDNKGFMILLSILLGFVFLGIYVSEFEWRVCCNFNWL